KQKKVRTLWNEIELHDRNVQRPDTFKEVFFRGPAFVYTVSPFQLNPRISAQQGLFTFAGNLRLPFVDNLAAADLPPEAIRKIILTGNPLHKRDILREL